MSVKADIFIRDYLGPYRRFHALAMRRMEAAALVATDQAATRALGSIRTAMQSAGLGRLGQALGATSDMKRKGVHRRGGGFSASGAVFIRAGSPRSRGAIEAYTRGTEIRPVRSRWLWFPTDDIQRVAGKGKDRERLTPGNWSRMGMDSKVGPLVPVKSVNGFPLLVVKNASVSLAGKKRSAKALTKSGRPGKGQVEKAFLVAFVAIPRTARAARVDVAAILRSVQQDLPQLFAEAMGRTFR